MINKETEELAFTVSLSNAKVKMIILGLEREERARIKWADVLKKQPATSQDPNRLDLIRGENDWRHQAAAVSTLRERFRKLCQDRWTYE